MVISLSNQAEQMLYGTLLILTFVSGLIDAACFVSLGNVFPANMTGNIVIIALAGFKLPVG